MQDDFKPQIKSRSTKDLLLIVGAPKKWNPKALKLAENELYLRKIDSKKAKIQRKYKPELLIVFLVIIIYTFVSSN